MRLLPRSVALSAGFVLALGTPLAASAAGPDWEAPFECGSLWSAGTRDGHSPSWYSVDFNGTDDEGAPVLATAGGQVTAVRDAGDTSYGKYVIIDHGSGYGSLYAHLLTTWVVEGQWLDQGDFVGLLGTSGGSSGPHLHFEERLNSVNVRAYFHGEPLVYNSTITARGCGDVPAVGDWNGDSVTDLGTYRRAAVPSFSRRLPDGTTNVVSLGAPSDLAVSGDWDGNGVDDVGVWSRMNRTYTLRTNKGRVTQIRMGSHLSVPVTGDWNGDGRTDVGMFRPVNGVFRLRADDGSVTRTPFGTSSSTPVTGDWNGDGRADIGVYDRATGTWQLRSTRTGVVTSVVEGGPLRLPVTGDWNGDGVTDIGTWAPATATFLRRTGPAASQQSVVRFGHTRAN